MEKWPKMCKEERLGLLGEVGAHKTRENGGPR